MALSINGALSGAGTGAAIGSAIPGIGTAIGAIGGGILGLFGGKKDNSKEIAQMQFQNEKKLMGLQNQYNKEMAEANHERNKEMWDYTNYENQVEHMKNAGLSVGLMYGQGGGMGASTSGGQGQGVSNPGTTAVQAGLQAKMMGVQLQNIQSQTALNSAQAAKAMSESEKIKGVEHGILEKVYTYVCKDGILPEKALGEGTLIPIKDISVLIGLLEQNENEMLELKVPKV